MIYDTNKSLLNGVVLSIKDNSFHRHCKTFIEIEASVKLRPDNSWWHKTFIAITKTGKVKDPYNSI